MSRAHLWIAAVAAIWTALIPASASASFVNFESQHIHPIALTPDGRTLCAVNTPDHRLAIFRVTSSGLELRDEVRVGIEPISVAVFDNRTAWVANHLSDSVSIVDLESGTVIHTLIVGDEPTDVVFAGSQRRAFVCVSQEDRIKIYNPSNLSAPPVEVELEANDPQALAVSPDGRKVYAAVFEGNNNTTIATRQQVIDKGGLPAPNPSGRPEVGLILKRVNGRWVDELGRNYNSTHPYTVVDHDLAILDANQATPAPEYVDGLGTLNFNLGVHPTSGAVYVSATEAINEVRFESALRGRFIETRLAIVQPGTGATQIVDLNPHIDTSVTPGPPSEIAQSISTPGAIAFNDQGSRLYLSALGSRMVAVLNAQGQVLERLEVGDGPTGVVFDSRNDRLYVALRFTNKIATVDLGSGTVAQRVGLYDPSPQAIKQGRHFLYNGRISSGHGDISCASCHAGAHWDAVAWDLGDPEGEFTPPPRNNPDPELSGFHPMKGPLVTQSLRGLANTQPFHWRGDKPDFEDFNGAFVSLQGLADPLPDADMQRFKDFILTVEMGPNPNQPLDRGQTPLQARGEQGFRHISVQDQQACVQCHDIPLGTKQDIFAGFRLHETQDFDTPSLRNLYEKVGFSRTGVSKRGFGFNHNGAITTLFEFNELARFTGFRDDIQRAEVAAFELAFDTGMAPAMGRGRTVTPANAEDPAITDWLAFIQTQHRVGNVDLIATGMVDGERRGYLFDGQNALLSDRDGEPRRLISQLLDTGDYALTFMGVPPGSGQRMARDRDEDGFGDATEIDEGTDPASPLSTPATNPVELAWTDLANQDGQVVVRWRTGPTSTHTGFGVWRATLPQNQMEPRHGDALIRTANDGPDGYRFVDSDVALGTTYRYELRAHDLTGAVVRLSLGTITAGRAAPRPWALGAARPNPFFPAGQEQTTVFLDAPQSGPATVRIFDAQGRLVRLLLDGDLTAGRHALQWDGRRENGSAARAGVYFYRLDAAGTQQTRKVILMD